LPNAAIELGENRTEAVKRQERQLDLWDGDTLFNGACRLQRIGGDARQQRTLFMHVRARRWV
jgi:hypothetical protein